MLALPACPSREFPISRRGLETRWPRKMAPGGGSVLSRGRRAGEAGTQRKVVVEEEEWRKRCQGIG